MSGPCILRVAAYVLICTVYYYQHLILSLQFTKKISLELKCLNIFPLLFRVPAGHVILWKKGVDIVAVGKQIINKNDLRVKLENETNGNTLVISLAEVEDAGEYTCQISSSKPTELKHHIKVRGKTTIKEFSYKKKEIKVVISCVMSM